LEIAIFAIELTPLTISGDIYHNNYVLYSTVFTTLFSAPIYIAS